MQKIDGKPVFSATDLVGYLACEHLTALERAALAQLVPRPMRADRELEIIRRRGFQHEARYLEELREQGLSVVTIERMDGEERGEQVRRQAAETIAAMESGAQVIFQATFFDGTWLGYADFLLRVDDPQRPSRWGSHHYEVADTKLARHVKAGAVLQLCSYVDQLEQVQGVRPHEMKVVLGGSARETAVLRVDDYMAYYRSAKRRFEEFVHGTETTAPITPTYPPETTYPDPVEHCEVCRWSELCALRRRQDDHLSLVAGITARQRKALVARELDTVERLAAAPLPFDPPLDGTSAASVERVREQARIQVVGRGLLWPIHELLLPKAGEQIQPERGLAILPEPNPGDLFLDLEGDPYALEDGVDYLFGILDTSDEFTAFWSFDPERPGDVTLAGEKLAFERTIDLIIDRLAKYPEMHVYHYAGYEPAAFRRLMGRHATREEQVDRLLRGAVLVDLFRAVRQGLRASVESYGIKRIEALYGFQRQEGLRDATSSIVEFEEWLELAESERPASSILASIQAYNRDDVLSNRRLRDWLETQRIALAGATGLEVPRPVPRSQEAPEQVQESDARVQRVAARLVEGVSEEREARSDEDHARWLLAQLLSWHRREAKVAYWEFFNRLGMDATDIAADKACIGPLEVVGPVGEPWRPSGRAKPRQTWRYRFSPQDYDIGSRSILYDPARFRSNADAAWRMWRIPVDLLQIDDVDSTIDLAWAAEVDPQHPEAIVPLNTVNDTDQRAALLRLGEWVAEHGVDAPGAWRAGRDLLMRRPPSVGQGTGGKLRHPDESELEAACRMVESLDAGTLAIQGPPGSGKTYTGAHMIVRLLAAGRTVGITANSHKVIANLLATVLQVAGGAVAVRAVQKISEGVAAVDDGRVTPAEDNGRVQRGLRDGAYNVGAGTAWLWSPPASEELVDVLFVDEAGQVSLANVLAMAGAARSIVLLGDPQQLDQPLQGSHPPGADRSALAHLLQEHDAMPEHLGLFLEHTWRLHPKVTSFTSTSFYEGKLESRPTLERQRIDGPVPLRGSGVRLVTVEHVGSESESPEEARIVAALVRALVQSGSTWVDANGAEHPLSYRDVLVVAPYNAQVGAIARELPEARVGTVDKFQGQEAPISIYSMTSSSPDDAPRGMKFLYSRNRLNVATSRARCVAVVVAEPALLRVRARTPTQMRLANALCRFVEVAEEQRV